MILLERWCVRGSVVGVIYASCKPRGESVCWVVGRMEWPLNIVFRPGSSEDNAVAWAVEERRATLAPV